MKCDFDSFLSLFDLPKKVSFEEFSKKLSVLDISDTSGEFKVRSDINTFLDKVSKKDDRKERIESYLLNLYAILVTNREESLKHWFSKYVELRKPMEEYFHLPSVDVLSGDTFEGNKYSKYGRVCKNVNFKTFYNTKKLYSNDSEYVIGLMKVMFERFHIRNSLVSPAFFDHICEFDGYDRFWLDFMIGANRPSVFNPVTYLSILNKLFSGEVLFAPVMGWNSYQFAFYSSQNWKHFISTDVIPSVVENGKDLHGLWEANQKNLLYQNEKTVDLYCCPSEKLGEDFVEKYKDKVDAVLFSPPYFDLEIYDSENQSFTNYPDYSEWLKCYWEDTVKICCKVMKKRARFGFVISNYVNKNKMMTNISDDMKRIAECHLNSLGHYRIKWSAISGSRQSMKTRNGNYEDLWLFER